MQCQTVISGAVRSWADVLPGCRGVLQSIGQIAGIQGREGLWNLDVECDDLESFFAYP